MAVSLTVQYIANKAIGDKFTCTARMTWENKHGSQPRDFEFDTPFDTREEAVADAKQRLVDAFASGAIRPY